LTVVVFSSQVCQWSCWQQIRAVRPSFAGNAICQGRKGQLSQIFLPCPTSSV